MATKQSGGLHLDRFTSGLHTNRSPIYTPKRVMGAAVVPLTDTLIDGLNTELSPQNTIARRPGFPKFCTSAFGSSEWPLAFYSCRLNGTLYNLVDTQTNIYTFTTTSKTSIYTKTTTGRSYFQQVGDILYFSDGAVNKKWDGDTVTNSGVSAPANAPTISNLNWHDITGHTQQTHAWSPNYAYVGPSSGVKTFWLEDPNSNIQIGFLNATSNATSANSMPKWGTTVGDRTVDGTMLWTCAGPIGTWAANTGSPTYYLTNFNPATVKNYAASLESDGTFSTSGAGLIWAGTLAGDDLRTASGPGTSKKIIFTNYAFNIPATATITGVRLTLGRASKGNGTVVDDTVKLVKGGVDTGNSKAQGGNWSTSYTQADYGGKSDLWGATLGPTDVNASDFGVSIITNNNNGTAQAYILRVAIMVFYTVGTATGTYYSSVVLDGNGNLQRVKTLGTSGGSEPTWSTQIGGTTTDNTITWECLGSGNLLAALTGWDYGYSFHTSSGLTIQPPKTHTSTVGPLLSLKAPIIGDTVTVSGKGSSDTQVDRVDLYRNYDGGSLLYFNNSVNNVNASTSWTIEDTLVDTDLDVELVGPIAHANDAPVAGIGVLVQHLGRLWGASKNALYFSAGPDCTNGDPNQAWPPANVFELPEYITALAATDQGLLVFTNSQLWVVLGGPQTLTFYVKPILKNFGVLSQNCVTQDADVVYCFTSNRQLMQLSFQGKREVSFDIADQLTSFSPASSSLVIHRSGKDEGLFISDGSANVFRYSLNDEAWSTKAQPVSGVGVLGSIETTAGTYTLLAGRPTGTDYILGRSLTSFVDGAASTYSAYATIGSLVLSAPGQPPIAVKDFILLYTTAGTDLTLSVLPNEVSGSFTSVPFSFTDPPNLSGTAYQPSTLKMRGHVWVGVQTPLPNHVKHLQIKVTMPTEDAKNELLGIALNV